MPTRKIVPRADNEGGIGTSLKKWASAFITAITCTTINGLTLAAQAVGFSLTGGTTPKTLTVTADTTLDEAVAMSSKLTIPGAWTTPTFDAGNFTASGAMTWSVEAGDVLTYAYIILGKMMTILFMIDTSTVGGTPSSALLIKIPGSKTATKGMTTAIIVYDNGAQTYGVGVIQAGQTLIRCYRPSSANWSASTNLTTVYGQITFEIN